MRQDNQTLHGAFGEFVTDLCRRSKRRDLSFPVKEFPFCRFSVEGRKNIIGILSDVFRRFCSVLLFFDWHDETMTSPFRSARESLYNLRFLFNCAATRLVPNVDYCHNAKMHSRGNAACVFCSLTIRSSKQDVVITLIVLFNR